MIGLFDEVGPFRIGEDYQLRRNNFTWNDKYSMVFVDNPVGVGYSTVSPRVSASEAQEWLDHYDYRTRKGDEDGDPQYERGYAVNQAAAAKDMVVFFERFYEIFSDTKASDLYLTGESYAGKYIPALADAISSHNDKSANPIPLKGLAIGDGLTDPPSQIRVHPMLALSYGIVTPYQAEGLKTYVDAALRNATRQNWYNATQSRDSMFDYFGNVTGGINTYDIRLGHNPVNRTILYTFLNKTEIKVAVNLGPDAMFEAKENAVPVYLFNDTMKSVAPLFPHLLDDAKYKVLLFQGEFDFRDGVAGQNEWIDGIEWSGQEGFRAAERNRTIWKKKKDKTGNDLAGYITEFSRLKRVVVLNAGHFGPADQPEVTKQMIEDFVG
ncbi:hypothetical protein HDV00_011316 [Rhizophlyctis rosea]|nr:hypothetical protein HDV00_011316 [Rhizophlyctis rosea]